MAKRAQRLNVTVSREMTVALEVLAAKTNLSLTTQAMVTLRQALHQTIMSDGVQLRLRQERALQTREDWLADRTSDTYVANALSAAQGEAADAPAE